MKVLFLNPPYFPMFSRESRSPSVTKSSTLYWPMFMCYAAGCVEEDGNELLVLDSPAMDLDLGATLEKVKAARRKEAEAAAKALGVHDIELFDIGDYPLGLDDKARFRLVDTIRRVQPRFMLTHALEDPYNTDHPATARMVLDCRMIAQAWGHNPGETVLGAPQLYLFEPHQTEQCGWKPDTILDITPVWDKKRAAIECMEGQQHLWTYYTNVAENRGAQFRRNSGGQAGGRAARYAEAFQSIFPRTVDEL
jgi:4-oxalomesaconate hydratase